MKQKKTAEPQYFTSATNMPAYNYQVYYMSGSEKILYFLAAFAVGAAVAYLFYGGLAKDEFGAATKLTYILNIAISAVAGIIAGLLFLPAQTSNIVIKKKRDLARQFRDMLDALTTLLSTGKNMTEAFIAVYDDMKIQYEEDAFIIKELELILSGINNNIPIEDVLEDFGRRSGNDDILSFSTVFRVCYQQGGNIKEVMLNTHDILSDKMTIGEDIETLLTSNKMEQNIMLVMPVALVGMIKLMSPEFSANFATPAGIISTTVSIVIFVVSYFIGKAILNIRL